MAYSYVVKGKSITLSSSVSGGTAEGFTFEWKKDGTVISGTGKTKTISNFSEADSGVYTVTAKKEAEAEAEDDVVDTFERGVVYQVVDKPSPVPTVDKFVGDTATLTVTENVIQFVPTTTDQTIKGKYTVQTQWTVGGLDIAGETGITYTTEELTITNDGDTIGVSQTMSEDDAVVLTEKFDVAKLAVTEKPIVVDPENDWYIVPLPHLKSSFTWIGYWVIDEIMKNPDWFDNHTNLKYAQQIQVIVKAFGENSDVMLMESRNGRILKVSDLK